jgi:hypothetical protein
MRSVRIGAVVLLIAAVLPPVAAQERIGRIISIDGYAQIDAFGTGRFIDAEEGDVLYGSTVVRTEYESWVTTEIGGRSYEIAPSSTTRVSLFASDRRREAGGVLGRLLRGIIDSLAPPEEDVADFGGRASQVESAGSIGSMFIVDVEPDEEFAAGREALEAGDYRTAVDHFRRIEYPEDGTFSLTEFYVSQSYALLGLGDFDAAIRSAFDYTIEEPSPARVDALPARLRLIVAIGAYYGGDDALADAAARSYVQELGLERADAEAIAIQIRLLRKTAAARAGELERAARSARPGVDWDALLRG